MQNILMKTLDSPMEIYKSIESAKLHAIASVSSQNWRQAMRPFAAPFPSRSFKIITMESPVDKVRSETFVEI